MLWIPRKLGYTLLMILLGFVLVYFLARDFQVWKQRSAALGSDNGLDVDMNFIYEDDENNHDESEIIEKGVTKVLLVTNMRGGSSLLGEAFNQNKDTFYWFEPIDGIYSYLYGADYGWKPLDIDYATSGLLRETPDFELEAILSGLDGIFNCDTTSLPADVMLYRNLFTLMTNSLKPYAKCVQTGHLSVIEDGQLVETILDPVPMRPDICKYQILGLCPTKFTAAGELESCHKELQDTNDRDNSSAWHISDEKLEGYRRCMNTSEQSCMPCFSKIQTYCSMADIVAVKTIRIRLWMLETILKTIPDLKVIVYYRDPRAMVYSRWTTGLLSGISNQDISLEAKVLCNRMAEELDILPDLLNKYKDNILQIRYEDLIDKPFVYIHDIYDFINIPLPHQVSEWFRGSLNATDHDPNDPDEDLPYDTIRHDAHKTAGRWRFKMHKRDIEKATVACKKVLDYLGYSI